eukprot:gene10248-13784_t
MEGMDFNNIEAPLLDEINELIEKERLLLTLKLKEQEDKTNQWKSKYDELLENNVASDATDDVLRQKPVVTDHIEALMNDKEITKNSSENNFVDAFDLLKMQKKYPWIFQFYKNEYEYVAFAKFVKYAFGSQFMASGTRIVDIHGCNLKDEYTQAILSILRNPSILAIDLSFNSFNNEFSIQLIEFLKDRKITPQYILLDNNVPLSETAVHFNHIIDVLSESTWGITVSLQDYSHSSMTSRQIKKISTNKINEDYIETVKHPLRIVEFLKSFNDKHDINVHEDNRKIHQKSDKLGKAGLQPLSVLGIKFCKMSKKSIQLLEVTLKICMLSLMDLDLSYSYMGYLGAQMIGRIISHPDCQIIRLCLTGNAVGDFGMKSITKSIPMNKSLTYLDLRSNDLTDVSIRVFVPIISHSPILHTLDLRGNKASRMACLQLTHDLKCERSPVLIKFFYDDLVTSCHIPSTVSFSYDSTLKVIYSCPNTVSVKVSQHKLAILHTIDTNIFNKYSLSFGNEPSSSIPYKHVLKWSIRPKFVDLYHYHMFTLIKHCFICEVIEKRINHDNSTNNDNIIIFRMNLNSINFSSFVEPFSEQWYDMSIPINITDDYNNVVKNDVNTIIDQKKVIVRLSFNESIFQKSINLKGSLMKVLSKMVFMFEVSDVFMLLQKSPSGLSVNSDYITHMYDNIDIGVDDMDETKGKLEEGEYDGVCNNDFYDSNKLVVDMGNGSKPIVAIFND